MRPEPGTRISYRGHRYTTINTTPEAGRERTHFYAVRDDDTLAEAIPLDYLERNVQLGWTTDPQGSSWRGD